MAEPRVLVQLHRQRLGIGADLAGARSQCIRGLQRMTTLHPRLATTALSNVNVELAMNHPPRDLGLILLGDSRLPDFGAAAGRATPRQRRFVYFIDMRGRRSTLVRPVVVSAFASRTLGIRLRRPFGEWRRLPLARPRQRLQFCQPGLQFSDLPITRQTTRTASIRRVIVHAVSFHADQVLTRIIEKIAREAVNNDHMLLGEGRRTCRIFTGEMVFSNC